MGVGGGLMLGLALVALALAACRGQATPTAAPTQAQPTDTAVANPTSPVVPTATVPPSTNTATPEPPTTTPTLAPTATPTLPATPDPNEGVGDVVFRDALDGTGNWYWTFEDDAASFGVSTEQKQLNAIAKQSGTWRFSIGSFFGTVLTAGFNKFFKIVKYFADRFNRLRRV